MKREWYVDDVEAHLLAQRLNLIAQRGGSIFTILDGPETRRSFVTVVWYVDVPVQVNGRSKK